MPSNYPKPPIYRRPEPIAIEIEDTGDHEWSNLIAELVRAIDRGKSAVEMRSKVVEAGWSRAFADFAIDWARDEIEIRYADNETSERDQGSDRQGGESGGHDDRRQSGDSALEAYEEFVRGVVEFKRFSGKDERLLGDPRKREWRPWEVVALDAEFRRRLCVTLESETLSAFVRELDGALAILVQAGITKGGSRAQQAGFSPIFHADGAILWDEGFKPQGAERGPDYDQVRQNLLGLGKFMEWYAYRHAQDLLSGVERAGPIDVTSLKDMATQARQNVAMGNDSIAVLSSFRNELEPHARVVSLKWLSTVLRIRYLGQTPVGKGMKRQLMLCMIVGVISAAIGAGGLQIVFILTAISGLAAAYMFWEYVWTKRAHVRQWWK